MVKGLQNHKNRRLLPSAEIVEQRLLLATYQVLNLSDSGTGSLRQAILDANSNPGSQSEPDVIDFAITSASPYTINVQTALPAITDPVLIDGTSQPGYSNVGTPIIEINGGGHTGDGLRLAPGSDGSTIKGLAIANFATGDGIHIQSNDNLIQSNFLGTNLAGNAGGSRKPERTLHRRRLGEHDRRQQHRGRQPDLGKWRQWNPHELHNARLDCRKHRRSQFRADHRFFGQFPASRQRYRHLDWRSSTYNTVGLPVAGNLVVANTEDGIDVINGSDFNLISGNAVGTTLFTGSEIGSGPSPNLGNGNDGILVASSSANTIGGATELEFPGQRQHAGRKRRLGQRAKRYRVLGNDGSLPPGAQTWEIS